MSVIRQGHLLKGLTAPALSDTMVQAAIKGLKNRESLAETPRAVMTLQLLKQARNKLNMLKMTADTKRAVWVAMTFLFVGNLRGSEILSNYSKKFNPQKTLLGADLKMSPSKPKGRRSRLFG